MNRTRADYPLAETQADRVRGPLGKPLSAITLDQVLKGHVTMGDLRITPEALTAQAEISRAAGRPALALNFERAAELVDVPQDTIMQTYELLRPGRATSKEQLLDQAALMRNAHGAERIARFIEEAAQVYEARGLYAKRF